MVDTKTVMVFILGAIFNALVGTYSRQTLYFALVASAALGLLYWWRDWFGNSSWRLGSTICIGLLAGSVASAIWWWTHPPSPQAEGATAGPSKFAPRIVVDDFGVANANM